MGNGDGKNTFVEKKKAKRKFHTSFYVFFPGTFLILLGRKCHGETKGKMVFLKRRFLDGWKNRRRDSEKVKCLNNLI